MNEQEIYNGSLKIKFVESNHAYYIAKKEKSGWGQWERKTGSTTFIGIKDKSTPLKYWVAKIMAKFLHAILDERIITKYDIDEAKSLHTKKLEEAATTGTKIHDWIERYVKGENPEMPSEDAVVRGVNAFLEWEKKSKVKFVGAELALYSKKNDYCGKLDAVGKIDGELCVIDYKTSTGLYNDVLLQTASYAKAYEEMGLGKIKGRWALRIEKRSEDEFKKDMDEKGNPNAEYVPFEAVYFDYDKGIIEQDFSAFLSAVNLRNWDYSANKRLEEYKKR